MATNDINSAYGSGGDPRGRVQNQIQHQQQRFEQQQGPMVNAFAQNYGRSSEADYGNYTDIMNRYRDIAGGGGASGGGGGGGYNAAGQFTPFHVSAGRAGYSDPFASYSGFQEFSKTGGYSPEDIANMRARGTSPIRAAYGNAERNVNQQRSLQGGYAPNAIAAQVKMAREQGQGMADATQNVEAGLAQARNQGRLAGLGGMSNIEGQRLSADVDVSKFNTGLDFQASTYNAGADERAQGNNIQAAQQAAAQGAASAAASRADQLRALQGMTSLYGTTPASSALFGNQLLAGVNSGANFGTNLMNAEFNAQQLPGAWDNTMSKVGQISNAAAPWVDYFKNNRTTQQPTGYPQISNNQYQLPGMQSGNPWGQPPPFVDPNQYADVDEWGNPVDQDWGSPSDQGWGG